MILRKLIIQLGFKANFKPLNKVNSLIKGLKSSVFLLSAGFAAATAGVVNFVKEAGKLEQVQIAFEVMTKSAKLGKRLMQDLFKFARETPFQIPGILNASRILLGTGTAADEMVGRLTRIGEVAAGLNVPLANLASIFGKVRAAGYLTGFEMERLRRLGIPLSEFLSKKFQATEGEILHMIRSKEISFDEFEDAWSIMVKDRFPNMMKRLLQTFFGLVSNIKDFIFEIKSFAGLELLPVLKKIERQIIFFLAVNKEAIIERMQAGFRKLSRGIELTWKALALLVRRFKLIIDQLGGFNRVLKVALTLIGAFVAYKTIMMFGSLASKILTILTAVKEFKTVFGGLKLFLTGAAFIGLLLILDDIHEYFRGTRERTITYLIIQFFEKKFPGAMKHTEDALKRLAKLAYHTTGLLYSVATRDWGEAKTHWKGIEEAFAKESPTAIGRIPKERLQELDEMIEEAKKGGPTKKVRELELRRQIIRGELETPVITKPSFKAKEKLKKGIESFNLPNLIRRIPDFIRVLDMFQYISPSIPEKHKGIESLINKQIIQKTDDSKRLNISLAPTINVNNVPANLDKEQQISAVYKGVKDAFDENIKDLFKITWPDVRAGEGMR